ncbi:MAG: cyclopropane-fatty-acyl-phospholipid synthase family protein [Pseudomonadota bacterium]
MLLARILRPVVKTGSLGVRDARGVEHVFGDGTGTHVHISLASRHVDLRLALSPKLSFGEEYMNGGLSLDKGSIYDLLSILMGNMGTHGVIPFHRLLSTLSRGLRVMQQFNPLEKAAQNVRHHYDLSGELYALFLDQDRQYSCAVFPNPDVDLDTAQAIKKDLIIAKLQVQPGTRVLDIGSGWGGMALQIARAHPDTEVVGVTLSKEQHAYAVARTEAEGLSGRVQFRLQDYRTVSETFDRIVSVGMFEHVGVPHYREYFEKIRDVLPRDGVALMHTIGRMDGPGTTASFIRKYIFPGGYSPALSEVFAAVEQTGLWVTDAEVLRLHYAETLRHWRQRFLAHREKAEALYDDRFCRMWEFYLAASECAFRYSGHMVVQLQLTRDPTAVPLTRDYLYRETAEVLRQHRAVA